MKAKTILSIIIIISFFSEWVNINNLFGFFESEFLELKNGLISGFEIPYKITKIRKIGLLGILFSYLMYLIPLLALINIILDIKKRNRLKINEFHLAFFFSVIIFIIVLNIKSDFYMIFEPGFYVSIFIPIIVFIMYIKSKIKTEEHIDNSIEYNRLKSMLDRNIITQETFIQETDRLFQNSKTDSSK